MNLYRVALPWAALAVAGAAMIGVADAAGTAKITGIAFVDSNVTGQGSRATLPANAQIYPSGTKITGTAGCPTTRYRTDGLIVAVIDYQGDPTAGSLQIVRQLPTGQQFADAPYYLDINQGRVLQYLGPIFDNADYALRLTWGLGQAQNSQAAGSFTLARNCPQPR
ncbi:MAG TPA: hypothetical protein VGF92_06560 [Stellaceae bacterium]|jgi:hypothetical protein